MAKMKSGGGLGAAMKSVGRNMAKADMQASSKKIPMKFAEGGYVNPGMAQSFGGGQARGGKAQTKGKKFSGVF